MMDDKISVAIATYNGESYLRTQLDSLYSQTRRPDEIIVSDDNSTDSTIEILEEYRQRYGLHYLLNKSSLGVNKNFEQAIRICTGDYIMICDQDDIWLPNKIEVSFVHMKELEKKYGNNRAVLITSNALSFTDGDLIEVNEKPCLGTITYYREILFNSNQFCQGCTMMLNRALVKNIFPFPDNFHHYPYDAHIAIIAIMIGKRCHIKKELMYYRHHANNVVANMNKRNSVKKRLNEKLTPIIYSFYNVPYFRQNYFLEVTSKFNFMIEDDRVRMDVVAIVSFAKSHFIGKVRAIMNIKNKNIFVRCMQLVKTVLSYPLRLIVPTPKL